jgi:hypothetical protein
MLEFGRGVPRRIGLDPHGRRTQDVGRRAADRILAKRAVPQLYAPVAAPERHLGTLLAGRLAVLPEHIGLAPARPRIGQQPARGQAHEQRAAEVIVAIDEGEPAGRRDPAGHLPSAHRGTPEAIALAIAVRTPELSRPWVSFAPGVDDAARLNILEVDAIAERHIL